MTEIFDHTIPAPMAWTVADTGGRAGLTRRLGAAEHAALDELLARTAHIPKLDVTRRDFDHPAINALMDEARHEMLEGHGAIVLSAFDLGRHSQEDYERIYWGLGTHLGVGAEQSAKRDRIGYVRNDPDEPPRGYTRRVDVSSTRAGAIPGTHEIGFDSQADTITLRHTARSREGFALGAVKAAEWIHGKKGFYEFGDILFGE